MFVEFCEQLRIAEPGHSDTQLEMNAVVSELKQRQWTFKKSNNSSFSQSR